MRRKGNFYGSTPTDLGESQSHQYFDGEDGYKKMLAPE
jgi:hypothetical protein